MSICVCAKALSQEARSSEGASVAGAERMQGRVVGD